MPLQSPAEIETGWQNEFPGTTFTIETLRQHLIQAHLYLQQTEFELDQLQLELNATGLPCRYWDARTHRQIKFHHHLKSRAGRDLHRALKALQSTHTQATQKPTKPEPPPAPPPHKTIMTIYQTARISIVEGKTITTVDYDAAYYLRFPAMENVGFFARQLSFENLIVPPEYEYALTHKGKTHQPCRCITIKYSAEEFLRLCRLEVESGTGHLLDGERHGYSRLI
jgi:hypothetical protein